MEVLAVSYYPKETGSRATTRSGRGWSWHDMTPDLLLGIAIVALLVLVVALALGWVV
jgi:hypothetical protein